MESFASTSQRSLHRNGSSWNWERLLEMDNLTNSIYLLGHISCPVWRQCLPTWAKNLSAGPSAGDRKINMHRELYLSVLDLSDGRSRVREKSGSQQFTESRSWHDESSEQEERVERNRKWRLSQWWRAILMITMMTKELIVPQMLIRSKISLVHKYSHVFYVEHPHYAWCICQRL